MQSSCWPFFPLPRSLGESMPDFRSFTHSGWCTFAVNRWCSLAVNYWCIIGHKVTAGKAHLYPQGQQPQMQAGGKGRWGGIVVEDGTVVQRDPPGEPRGQEGAPQHKLIGFQGRIGRIQTRIALDLQPTHHVDDGDKADFPNALHRHGPLCIEFPLVVRPHIRLKARLRESAMPLIAACQLGGLE